MSERRRVAYVIAFSAPPVLYLSDFLRLLLADDWDSYVILSPTAATWVDVDLLAKVSGHPVLVEPRRPKDQDPLPPADAVFAAPLTFNGLNKWAAGISDTLALGLLNESLGLDLPVIAGLCINTALQRHPAYDCSIAKLTAAGATIVKPAQIIRRTDSGAILMDWSRMAF